MKDIINLDNFPLDALESDAGRALVNGCQQNLAENGVFNLEGFLRPTALQRCVNEVRPPLDHNAFEHRREHNIYFEDQRVGLSADHPALKRFETINHTVCADQIPESLVCRIYEWSPFVTFLATVMKKDALYQMADPLARANVLAYRPGEALNWHFDRSEFTTTLILQSPENGGEFQYRSDLRSEKDENYDGVARLVAGKDGEVQALPLPAGTLSVFKGKNTAHRLTPVEGSRDRIVAVFSYYETSGVTFSESERIGFYGRPN